MTFLLIQGLESGRPSHLRNIIIIIIIIYSLRFRAETAPLENPKIPENLISQETVERLDTLRADSMSETGK